MDKKNPEVRLKKFKKTLKFRVMCFSRGIENMWSLAQYKCKCGEYLFIDLYHTPDECKLVEVENILYE